MEAENFTIKDPEILLEKLTSLTKDFSILAKDREMKEIFTQIENLKSGLSKGMFRSKKTQQIGSEQINSIS